LLKSPLVVKFVDFEKLTSLTLINTGIDEKKYANELEALKKIHGNAFRI